MLDIKLIREEPDLVRQRLAARGAGDENLLGELVTLDEERRRLVAEVEKLKAERNRVSKEIGGLIGQGKREEAEQRKAHTRAIGDEISALDAALGKVSEARDRILLRMPNLPHATVPPGRSSSENVIVRSWGTPATGGTYRSHVELCESLGLVDFTRGAKLAGSGFLLYTGEGARLERALIQYLLNLHTREHGYTEVSPPYLVNSECMVGVGQFPKFEDQAYAAREGLDRSTEGQLYLVPTAEAPVANIHRGEILREEQLPIRYCAYSPCFRAEAGAAGLTTRGMIRVHQFDKVELIKIVHPDQGESELEALVKDAERVLQSLGLAYRVVLLCTGDMGFASAKTYDLEVWAPGQGAYLEVSSCSNCEEFQARRMDLRYRPAAGPNRFPHILNGSGTALARLFVALIETYQQPDGTVQIPEGLQAYFGAERIGR